MVVVVAITQQQQRERELNNGDSVRNHKKRMKHERLTGGLAGWLSSMKSNRRPDYNRHLDRGLLLFGLC